jgi:hypothetical protein
MRRTSAALALALMIGSTAACADLTTTGEPADEEVAVQEAGEGAGEAHGGGSGEETGEMEQTEAFAETVVGMTADEAQAATEAAGYTYRVVEIDGEPQAVTLDYRIDRVNVALEDDVVTSASVG